MLSASKSGSGAVSGYNLTRSLRFRASASAYLNRTPSVTGNNYTWTYSAWVKRGALGIDGALLWAGVQSSGFKNLVIKFDTSNTLTVYGYVDGGSTDINIQTTQVFRDPSAFYHIVVVVDTTQATSSNRVKIYVNGLQVTSLAATTYPALNYITPVNEGRAHNIGRWLTTGSVYFDGYLTEVNFIDGQALTPSSFGSTNTLTGVWQPARYTGTYGTNGFYLPFTDNSALTTSSNVGLGKDFSGNGNYWTTNNISITAGVTYDSMTDVPTLTSATAANFAVLNPVDKASGVTTSNANLRATTGTAYDEVRATLAVSTKNYFEVTNSGTPSGSYAFLAGFQITQLSLSAVSAARANEFRIISRSGTDVQSGTTTLFSPTAVGNGEVIQFAIDVAAGKAWIGRASAWYNSTGGTTGDPATGANPTFTFTATEVYAVVGGYSVDLSFNAGQRPFSYTPPTGFVALNTYNLPTSTILQGNKVMDATLWTGNSSTQSIVNAAAFKTDFVWIKNRTGGNNHALFDSVRGATLRLYSDSTIAEQTEATTLTAFNSNGFNVSSSGAVNASANNYVGWQWQAGQGSTSSNTNGSITSTVSVNASAGFSVVTYTGNGTNGATVGHGLGVAPAFFVVKTRGVVGSWQTYHQTLTGTTGIFLNLDSASFASSAYWNNTNPTSSVFSLGTSSFVNVASQTQVAYCWTPITGYSSFGSYTGNGSVAGPFVYLGFKPRWIMVKPTGSGGWAIYDTARKTYNTNGLLLFSNLSDAEVDYGASSADTIDILSNGFRVTSSIYYNNSGASYIYAAFATSPFKNSLAF